MAKCDAVSEVLPAYRDAMRHPSARRELWGWCALAILSLGIAGAFAVLLAWSRTPGLGEAVTWPADFFRKALVVHVVFAFIIWFLAVFGAFLQLTAWAGRDAPPRLNAIGAAGLPVVAVACLLLLIPALLDRGVPTLNNYVPAIIDPLFYLGLALLAGGLCLPVLRLLLTPAPRGEPHEPVSFAVSGAAVIFLVALICFGLAFQFLRHQTPSFRFNEELFWGGGHMMQFLSTTLLIVTWAVLARIALGREIVGPRLIKLAAAILILAVLPAPFFYYLFPPFSADQMNAFTRLQWILGVPTLLVVLAGIRAVARLPDTHRPLPWGRPAFLCLVLSIGVFGLGGVLGLFIDGTDTRTPAHYHGVISGVTLAFMGLFYEVFLPLLRRGLARDRVVRVQLWLFAVGQSVAVLGLFWAGGFGAPRKTAGAEQGLEGFGAIAGMAMNGLGAAVAVAGGVMFIWLAGRAMFGRASEVASALSE